MGSESSDDDKEVDVDARLPTGLDFCLSTFFTGHPSSSFVIMAIIRLVWEFTLSMNILQ